MLGNAITPHDRQAPLCGPVEDIAPDIFALQRGIVLDMNTTSTCKSTFVDGISGHVPALAVKPNVVDHAIKIHITILTQAFIA